MVAAVSEVVTKKKKVHFFHVVEKHICDHVEFLHHGMACVKFVLVKAKKK